MGKNERQTYPKAIRLRYRRASKKAKAAILDEFCAVCGYHRKYAIRLLNRRGKPAKSPAVEIDATFTVYCAFEGSSSIRCASNVSPWLHKVPVHLGLPSTKYIALLQLV